MGGGKAQTARFVGEKHGHARDQKSARQPFDDRLEQRANIGLRIQATAEFNQRFAVIVAMAVEDTIDPVLNPPLQRVKGDRDNEDRKPQAPLANRCRQTCVHHLRGQGDHAEIGSQQQTGGQRVGHAPLEDQVGIHQPVANDGPAEGQGQEDDGKSGQTGEGFRKPQIEEKRHRVKERERERQPGVLRG